MVQSIHPDEISNILAQELEQLITPEARLEEVGHVLQVGDGVARVYGLDQVMLGEVVELANGVRGLVLNLEEKSIGVMVLGASDQVKEGDQVVRTGSLAHIEVGEGMLGRVVDPLGKPIDGKGPVEGTTFSMPLERKAPGVIYREPVEEPLQTGIKVIDAMIPIGKGQRELIVGDRQTGKSTIALDTIINQREAYEQGSPVFCIYVATGQKASTIAHVVATLEKYGAMAYTTVVAAPAAEPAALQYLSPFTGTAIGEYFRDTGRSALVVYDDLSKQAVAYREIALLLRRPPGREAYPGDIFYLQARILERGAKIISNDAIAQQMNDLPACLKGVAKGGGSLTSLPIIETQAGDVSAYIPTNVISITDGQVFLESSLFHAGIKPAINIGISVSRVGGAAQLKAMKQVAGTLKLEQAQYRELVTFAKFGAELDSTTQRILSRGRKNQALLNQGPHQTVEIAHQIALVYAATEGFLDPVPLEQVPVFCQHFLTALMRNDQALLKRLVEGGKLREEDQQTMQKRATQVVAELSSQNPHLG